MAFQIFHSIKQLIEYADDLLGEVDVVSFDLFDTLLVRRLHDPDLIKVPVARYLSTLALNRGIDMPWQQVQERRDEIEQELRRRTGEQFDDHEAHYPTLMAQLLESILGEPCSEQLLAEVTQYELGIENAMLVPRQEFVQWIEKLTIQEKRIFVISDMYLPAEHLSVLLEHAGMLGSVEQVISSADSFLAKASGKGYELVKDKFELEPSRWLHIGDNPVSDGLRPDDRGITALVIQDPDEFHRRAIAARYYFYSRSRAFWRGRAMQQLMAPIEAENSSRSTLYNEGYNFFGPLIGVFVQMVAEHCMARGIKRIFFLSREGWMFKQVWDKTTPVLYPAQELPSSEYLYVSRLALAGASCVEQGLTPDNARIVFLPPGNRDFSDVCRIFNFDPGPLEPHLQRHQLAMDTTLSPLHAGFDSEHSWRLENLLKDDPFQQEIKRQAKPQNEALQRYLEGAGFYDQADVALVDIGWLGTIQRFFYDAIKHREDRPNCHGLLFGATRGIPFNTAADNHIRGLIYDRDSFDLGASAIMYARDLFEEACRAPHPTTVGYRVNEKGSAEPVFRGMEDTLGQSEREQDKHFTELQQGVLDSAQRYAAASSIISANTEGFRPWVNYLLVSKLAFAGPGEIRRMRYKHHLDDFHGTKKPKFFQHPKIFHNPWEVKGWRFYLACLFPGRVFRRHLRTMVTR